MELLIANLLKFEAEEKGRALLKLRNEINLTIELLNNQLTNDQSKADSLSIYLKLFIFDRSEKFEKFVLIL